MLRIGFLKPVKILLRWLILKYPRLSRSLTILFGLVPLSPSVHTHFSMRCYFPFFNLIFFIRQVCFMTSRSHIWTFVALKLILNVKLLTCPHYYCANAEIKYFTWVTQFRLQHLSPVVRLHDILSFVSSFEPFFTVAMCDQHTISSDGRRHIVPERRAAERAVAPRGPPLMSSSVNGNRDPAIKPPFFAM